MIQLRSYGTVALANLLVSGGVISGKRTTDPFNGLVGKTITFTAPAGSHTFTQPATQLLSVMSFKDVKEQLEAAIANLVVRSIDNKLAFSHATPGTAVTLAALDEPARTILGLDNDVAIAGEVVDASGGTPPTFEGMAIENGAVTIAVSTT